MRFLAYFGTVGALLLAMLLLAGFALEPSRPKASMSNSAVEGNLPRPRILNRVEQYSATPRITPLVQTGYSSPDPVSAAAPAIKFYEPEQRSGANAAEPAPVQRTVRTSNTAQRGKIGNPDAARRPHRSDPAYLSYAQERRGQAPARVGLQSSAEGTLGPH